MISWKRWMLQLGNYVDTPYSRNDIQLCHFGEKKMLSLKLLHAFAPNLLRSVQTWDTHQLLYLAYPYMGHIDVLGCKNINSVILKQICLNNLRKFILCNRHMMQPSPHKSHNNMSLTTCMGLSLSCILTKSTLSVIQMRSNIILRNPEWCPHLTFSGGRSVIWIAAIGHYKWCYYHWAITWTPHLIPLITRPSIEPLITRPSSARYITCGVCWTVWS